MRTPYRAVSRLKGTAIIDAEVVHLTGEGVADFDALHSRTAAPLAVACAFDLLMFNGDDLRRRPLVERKAALRKLLGKGASRGGIQYVAHIEGDGEKMFTAVCKHGLEGIVSKKLDSPYRSGRTKSWIKVKNQKSAAATRAIDGTF